MDESIQVSAEDQSYAKALLGVKTVEGSGVTKVLGVQWNVSLDELQFDTREVTQTMEDLEPTKRNIVSITAKFFECCISSHHTLQDVLSEVVCS